MTTNEPNNQQEPNDLAGPAGSGDGGGSSAGVMAMHSHLKKEPKGFWADAWSQVLRRPSAVIGLIWIGIIAFFAVFSPLIANGHPFIMWELEAGVRSGWSSPLVQNLSSVDVLLLLGGIVVPLWLMMPTTKVVAERVLKTAIVAGSLAIAVSVGMHELSGIYQSWSAAPDLASETAEQYTHIAAWLGGSAVYVAPILFLVAFAGLWPLVRGEKMRSERMLQVIFLSIQAGLIALLAELVAARFDRPNVPDWMREIERADWYVPVASICVSALVTLVFLVISMRKNALNRILLVLATGMMAGAIVSQWWMPPLQTFDYVERERAGEVEATYALIPYSPHQRHMTLRLTGPGQTSPAQRDVPPEAEAPTPFLLGNDSSGQDLLSQLLHACRLSISIGLVATGIAVTIGVSLGALMGYFGGWVDMLLYRLVEIVMAIPVLFVLIVASAVLPKNIYVMMAVIGCFTWTNAARYTRAEFMRLREQDFVQAAKAVGLPMRSVLFRHMLPNGVTPVLVEASFAVAAAILFEAILSFLGLGPADQASWGRLLADAFNDVGDFVPWIAIFPGFAIFLMVLSLVLVGEALRDAIDPKLKKAAQA